MRFFFFQAEDGIRDLTVTGVQTCALPICSQQIVRFLVTALASFFFTKWQIKQRADNKTLADVLMRECAFCAQVKRVLWLLIKVRSVVSCFRQRVRSKQFEFIT